MNIGPGDSYGDLNSNSTELFIQNNLNTINIYYKHMAHPKREGLSVLDKISSNPSKQNKAKSNKEPINLRLSPQTIVLTILVTIVLIALVGLFLSGKLTGALVGTAGTNLLNSNPEELDTQAISGSSQSQLDTNTPPTNEAITNSKTQNTASSQGTNSNTALLNSETDRTQAPILLELEYSKVPNIDATVSLPQVKITTNNLGSSVRVNGDLLDASSEVSLQLNDFFGRFSLNEHSLTLSGSIRQIRLNGISLLSDQEISIEIDALSYDNLQTDQISFSYLYLEPGSGELNLEDKLSYILEDTTIDLYDYSGQLIVNPENSLPTKLKGEVESIESSSSELKLAAE
jgi:hypothetical protein